MIADLVNYLDFLSEPVKNQRISLGLIVLIFLGVPLLAGYLTRKTLVAAKGATWYDGVFMPKFGPTALFGLLYTIVLMFAMQGHRILSLPLDVLRIAVPMLRDFISMSKFSVLS